MNRRGFLSTLAAALAGATLDPERLLWRPGAKTIFLPSVQPVAYEYVSYGTLVTPEWVSKDVLRVLMNSTASLKRLESSVYSGTWVIN